MEYISFRDKPKDEYAPDISAIVTHKDYPDYPFSVDSYCLTSNSKFKEKDITELFFDNYSLLKHTINISYNVGDIVFRYDTLGKIEYFAISDKLYKDTPNYTIILNICGEPTKENYELLSRIIFDINKVSPNGKNMVAINLVSFDSSVDFKKATLLQGFLSTGTSYDFGLNNIKFTASVPPKDGFNSANEVYKGLMENK